MVSHEFVNGDYKVQRHDLCRRHESNRGSLQRHLRDRNEIKRKKTTRIFVRIRVVFFRAWFWMIKFLIAVKLSVLIVCSMRQASSTAIFFIYAQADEPLGKDGMTFIHGLSDLHSLFCQGDITVIHMNVTIFPKVFHGYADAGL